MTLKIPGEEPFIQSIKRFMPTDWIGAKHVSHAFFSSNSLLVVLPFPTTFPASSATTLKPGGSSKPDLPGTSRCVNSQSLFLDDLASSAAILPNDKAASQNGGGSDWLP